MWGLKYLLLSFFLSCFVPSSGSAHLPLPDYPAPASDHPFQGLIYGKVTLQDKEVRQGVLLWNNRQLFWEDIFDAQREEGNALDFLNSSEIKQLSDQEIKDKIEWGFMHLWEKKIPSRSKKFSCRFGDLGSMTVVDEKSVTLYFKNGSSMRVRGSERYRDLGNRLILIEPNGEWQKISWETISRIEFMPTPANALTSPVRPLFGTVQTDSGELTGFIKWDQDETMTSFKLDGKKDGQHTRISFGSIRRIEKTAPNACEITLISDKKITLSDNDDVGPTHHGLTVFVSGVGSMVVRWKDFKSLTFDPYQTHTRLMGYLDFKVPKVLRGRVNTRDGQLYKGKFIFDLDEQWDFETIEGNEGTLRYSIALRNISLIEPQPSNATVVVLKNGRKLLLNGHHDVTDKNWGVLAWKEGTSPKYLPWKSVQSIYLP